MSQPSKPSPALLLRRTTMGALAWRPASRGQRPAPNLSVRQRCFLDLCAPRPDHYRAAVIEVRGYSSSTGSYTLDIRCSSCGGGGGGFSSSDYLTPSPPPPPVNYEPISDQCVHAQALSISRSANTKDIAWQWLHHRDWRAGTMPEFQLLPSDHDRSRCRFCGELR